MSSLDRMRRPPEGPTSARMFVYLTLGLLLWGAQLALVYFLHAVMCARGVDAWFAKAAMAGVTAIAAVALALALVDQRRTGRVFGLADDMQERAIYDSISRFLCFLALVGILWSGAGVAIVSAC